MDKKRKFSSSLVDGPEQAASRSMLRAAGFEDDDLLNDINFKNYLGGVLQNIIEDSLDNGAQIGNLKSNSNTYIEPSD